MVPIQYNVRSLFVRKVTTIATAVGIALVVFVFAGSLMLRHGISEATFYKWKAKYGGMEVSDAKRLKTLEDENRRLKKLLAESMLDNAALKDLLGKNV